MAGHFELFTDHQFHIRFQLLAPDGSVLAVQNHSTTNALPQLLSPDSAIAPVQA